MTLRQNLPLVDYAGLPRSLSSEAAMVILGGVAIGLLARLSIPVGLVPITGQTLGVLLVATVLGGRRGAAAVALYVAMGSAGLPVFAAGAAGPLVLLGPTGGYLMGMLAAAWVVGRLCEHPAASRPAYLAAATVLGHLVIYAAGTIFLARFTGWDRVIAVGVLPFLPGDLVKTLIVASVVPALRSRVS